MTGHGGGERDLKARHARQLARGAQMETLTTEAGDGIRVTPQAVPSALSSTLTSSAKP